MFDDLVLVQYYHPGSTPFQSITQLPEKEAFALAEKLYANSQCKAHRRFGSDFPSYYRYRLGVERRLYEDFIKMGGEPETQHPYYFVLQHSDVFYQNFDRGTQGKIRLCDINTADISFTFGDSMAVMESENRVDPFSLDRLYEYIQEYDGDVYKLIESTMGKYNGIIEAQLWTNKYFHHPL